MSDLIRHSTNTGPFQVVRSYARTATISGERAAAKPADAAQAADRRRESVDAPEGELDRGVPRGTYLNISV